MFSCRSALANWSFLVLNGLCAVGYFKAYLQSTSLVLIFIASCVGSLVYIGGMLSSFSIPTFISLGLLCKLGLFPFHFWVVKGVISLMGFPLFTFLGLQKLGPLYLFLRTYRPLALLGMASAFLGLIIILSSFSVNIVLVGSSFLQFWILVTQPLFMFFIFFPAYLIRLLFCCHTFPNLVSPMLSWLSLAGLPPFALFFSKVVVLYFSAFWPACILLLVSGSSFYPYCLMAFTTKSSTISSFSFLCFFSSSWLLLILSLLPLL